MNPKKLRFRIKLWIEQNGADILGEGGAELLKAIQETGSIAKAAEKIGVSYKFAWAYIKKIEKNLGEKIVITHKGGVKRGWAKLTEAGEQLLQIYNLAYSEMRNCLTSIETPLSFGIVKNNITIKIKEIREGEETSIIIGTIQKNTALTAVITTEALESLNLKKGLPCKFLIKATAINVRL
ncbi:MAG: LysR family transcriptional regulator [Candidatus Asgardarchaeum sp.]